MPNAVPELAWGYDSILVVCDRITKMAHFVLTIEKTSVEGVARITSGNDINYQKAS